VSVANGLGRLGCGALADKIVQRGRPRAVLLVAADLAGALAMFLFFVSGTSVPMALIAAAVSGAAYGAIWTLIPTLAADLFGRKHFGANYALILPAVSLAAAVYSKHADDDGCAGAACFGTTFLATAAACGGGAVMALLLGVRSRKRYASAEPPESLLAAARAGETVV
jgi:MFS family permease